MKKIFSTMLCLFLLLSVSPLQASTISSRGLFDLTGDVATLKDDNNLKVTGRMDGPAILIVTITNPLDLTEADALPIWTNGQGTTFTISAIYSKSDTDDTGFTLKESSTATDFTTTTAIEAINITDAGTGCYYSNVTSGIDNATIADGCSILFDNDATDDPGYITVTIVGNFAS